MLGFANVLFGGVAYGFVLFLMASGLSVTFGLMGFANMAHSVFAMIGGYVVAVLVTAAGWPFLAALALAAIASAAIGTVLEMALFRRFYGFSELDQVLLTIGVVYVAIAAATYLFGPHQMTFAVPSWLDGTLRLGRFDFNNYRLFLIGIGLLLLVILIGLIDHTLFGAKVRAAVVSRRMTASCGIDVGRLFTIAFAIGTALAGIGGALSVRLLGLDPNFALKFLTELLIVVSVGGLGSLRGTFIAALLFGVIDSVGKYLVPEMGAFIIYAAALMILTLRPQGLAGRTK
jgi:branched-chain amino acid transport system permease protein